MRTRCPVCNTVFRVTTEQLRLRAGKVRCGNCQAVFNAFDELVSDDSHEPLITATPLPEDSQPEESGLPESGEIIEEQATATAAEPEDSPDDDEPGEMPNEFDETSVASPATGEEPEVPDDVLPENLTFTVMELSEAPTAEEPETSTADDTAEEHQAPLDEPLIESAEESTLAAREAGLVAARELNETSSFNRWSAGTLANDSLGGFEGESSRPAAWPFVVVSILLSIGLFGQLLYYFRTDIVLRFPSMAGIYEMAAVDIPLPRNSALVSIETSDLQSDTGRGLFVLQATLKNRAPYAQAWPALELSLTDTNDAVVSRRVMYAVDYLPTGTTSDAFPANGEIAVKLWVEAKESGASGYRLYLFYP